MSNVVRHGFGSRLKNSIVGALFGVLLFFGSFALLAWNEYDAIRQTGAITELDRTAVADVPSDVVDPALDQSLVHMIAEARTEEELEYDQFDIREKAIRLRWDSSIYQWEEDSRRDDDKTTYTYHKKWVDRKIDASRFHSSGYDNGDQPKRFRDGSDEAKLVQFGAFKLSAGLIAQINDEHKLPLAPDATNRLEIPGTVADGVFFTGNPSSPEIGDEKVEVFIVGPMHDATVMAEQYGDSFRAFQTKVGIPKEILYLGRLSKAEVIDKQRFAAAMRRWLIRGGGFLCMWFGLSLIFSPFRALVSFIPFASRILSGAIGFVTFFIALALSAIVIAIAWFAVRPLLSLGLIVLAIVAGYLVFRAKGQEEEAPKPEPIIEV